MDAAHFDTLARRLGAPRSRRAALGAVAASGLLSALGLGRAAPEVLAAQGGTCVLAFAANVRLGPGMNQVLTTNGAQPGELRGQLAFALSDTGALQNAALTLPDGSSLPVVGQATGTSLQLRIGLRERFALIAVGVGEKDITACEGAIDGLATGPNVGDLGDWHAVAVSRSNASGDSGANQQGGGGKKNGGTAAGGGAPAGAGAAGGGRTGRTGRGGGTGETAPPAPPPTSGTTGPSAPTGPGGPTGPTGPTGTTGTTGTSGASGATSAQPACASGMTRCADVCVDLNSDKNNCGTCGHACAAAETCTGGVCQPPPPCGEQGQSCATADCCVGYCGQDETCECVGDGSECAHIGTGGCCSGQPCNPDGYCGICGLVGAACASDVECCQGNYAALCCFDGVSLTTRCTDVTNIGFVCPGEPTGPVTCAAGLTDCGGECVDLMSNAGNCGACGASCGLGGVCIGGACSAPPPSCLVNGSPCTYGVDVCCAGLTCYASICQCSPPGDVCGDPTVCCSGVCNGDGFCD